MKAFDLDKADLGEEFRSEAWTNRSHRTLTDLVIPAVKSYVISMTSEGFTKKQIAEHVGIPVGTIREWLQEDREFAARYEAASEDITDALEQVALRRAMEGVLKPVVNQGRVVMDPNDGTKIFMIREYSDDLIKFMLKGRRRQTYGDKVETSNLNATISPEGVLDELKRRIAAQPDPDSQG